MRALAVEGNVVFVSNVNNNAKGIITVFKLPVNSIVACLLWILPGCVAFGLEKVSSAIDSPYPPRGLESFHYSDPDVTCVAIALRYYKIPFDAEALTSAFATAPTPDSVAARMNRMTRSLEQAGLHALPVEVDPVYLTNWTFAKLKS